jgi:ATP-dependent DNA helicase DinG
MSRRQGARIIQGLATVTKTGRAPAAQPTIANSPVNGQISGCIPGSQTRYSPPVQELSDYFGEDSPLKAHLPGFQPRTGQSWMADAVADAIQQSSQLVVEAGTGTGKTFAYLLPALLSGRKTIISTGTKALQDQLYHRDLPLVCKAVGRPVTTALLKGRANYLCLHRLDTIAEHSAGGSQLDDLDAVRQWRHQTKTGDRAELNDVAEDSGVWPLVTSTMDNCLGSECPVYSKCHVVRARRAAQEAELVVVNHHLLLADLAMKEEGFIEFLPGADAIIIDEAHQIPDLAAQFFGISLGSRELERLFEELRAATLPLRDAEFQRRLDTAQTALRVLRADAPRDEGRHELAAVIDSLRTPMTALSAALKELLDGIGMLSEASADLEKLYDQLFSALERLAQLASDETWDGLRWLDVNPRSIRLHLTPLDVADTLSSLIGGGGQAWIFTSATLAVGDDFSHFMGRMGLTEATGLTFPSPYALDENGLVWLPPGLPAPSDPEHTGAMLEQILPLLGATNGGMFVLFTSHRALNAARRWLRSRKKRLAGRPLLVQGEAPRDDLLRRFRRHGDAVLLGTGSFWEGVDVRGSALTVVAIDKLPFASPEDPLMMARLEFIRRQGGNGFTGHQLPLAVLALKQGVGRLLRDETDYGVIVLCDPRLRSKGYGKVFLDSLAPMPHTDSIDDVSEFLQRHEPAVPAPGRQAG